MLRTRPPRVPPESGPARLACIRHAASVDPEPGSNSPPIVLAPSPAPVLLCWWSRCAFLLVLSRTDPYARRLPNENALANGPLAPSSAHNGPVQVTAFRWSRAAFSAPACQRAPVSEGKPQSWLEGGSPSNITRGHPYPFGGRSLKSQRSLPYRHRPCQERLNTARLTASPALCRLRYAWSSRRQQAFRSAFENPVILASTLR